MASTRICCEQWCCYCTCPRPRLSVHMRFSRGLGWGPWVLTLAGELDSRKRSALPRRVEHGGVARALSPPLPDTWLDSVLVFTSSSSRVVYSAFPLSLMRKNTSVYVFILLLIISSNFLPISY